LEPGLGAHHFPDGFIQMVLQFRHLGLLVEQPELQLRYALLKVANPSRLSRGSRWPISSGHNRLW
jgi:hypothetical protein